MARRPSPADLESKLLADARFDRGWRLINRFAKLVRESGSADEDAAADHVASELTRMGVEFELFRPSLYLSLPRHARVEAGDGTSLVIQGKPPSFSASTSPAGVTAPLVHVPAASAKDTADIFEDLRPGTVDVRARIVVSEGYAMPLAVQRFERGGAVGQIYINPGKRVHWGICTSIWGMPTDESIERKPHTPVLAISRPDGDRLLERLDAGAAHVTVHTALDEGWYPCKLPVATIRGAEEDFVLVHGHYDSWDIGIGDNAVGDATLLELARILHKHRRRLRRSVKIAWWPGHSMGRYAGSTWFADRFALDLRKHCVAAINIDSPGCWNATAYEEVMWMAEVDGLCRAAIRDVTGVEPHRLRPIRAGDYSFNQVGLTSFFMLLSNIPKAQREKLGFYPVGGCGGNIAWHTEDDRLEVADRANLERDLKVYLTTLARIVNAEILPLDYRATLSEIADAVATYRQQAGDELDWSGLAQELAALDSALSDFYRGMEDAKRKRVPIINETLKELARVLVPLGYAAGERFAHDPALPLGTVPRLAAINRLQTVSAERQPFLRAGIIRQVNYVANRLHEATRLLRTMA